MTKAIIHLNEIEPAPLSLRHPLGVNLDLSVAFKDQKNAVVDPTSLLPQFALLPRSRGGLYGYDMTVTDAANGIASVSVPGTAIMDRAGYTVELYQRVANQTPGDPALPVGLLAQGVLAIQGTAYQQYGPLGVISVPVVTGPPGPTGPEGQQGVQGVQGPEGIEGPQGIQGIRGGTWYVGDDYPMNAMPDGAVDAVEGDMYLKAIDPDGGSCWRWNTSMVPPRWTFTGADITGPVGPEGPQGPSGGGAYLGPTPPPDPVDGQLWWNTSTKTLAAWVDPNWELVEATWAGP